MRVSFLKYVLFSIFLVVLLRNDVMSQQIDPVRWSFSSKKLDDRIYEICFTAIIAQPWHIYAQDMSADVGFPTTIAFTKNPLMTLEGKPREIGTLIEKEEKVLGATLKYYSGKVSFVQIVKLKAAAKTRIGGIIYYMACTNQNCLPQAERKFMITVE